MLHRVRQCVLTLTALVLFANCAPAQGECSTDETSARVPSLEEFHTVIYKLWHDAWPKNDFEALKSLYPDIERGCDSIESARLPGILHEKAEAWQANVKKLREIVAAYKEDIGRSDNQQLRNDAERLHAQYEMLVRTIRPPLQELQDFHAVLYVLYHHSMPQDSMAAVHAGVTSLQNKMTALEKAVLPARLKDRQEAFLAARARLAASLNVVSASLMEEDPGKTRDAIEDMHTAYEALAKTLE